MGTGLTRSIRSAFKAGSESDGCSFIGLAETLTYSNPFNAVSLTGLGGL